MTNDEVKKKLEEWQDLFAQIKDIFTKLSYLDELDDHSRNIADAYIAMGNICKYEIEKYTNMLKE